MPYKDIKQLPKPVREAVTTTSGKRLIMEVVNSQLEAGKSENVAWASAWAALQRAGWEKDENGKWRKVEKQPTAGQVHVPGTEWEKTPLEKVWKDIGLSDEEIEVARKYYEEKFKVKKAEYQGREVDLDKPFRTPGESKKFAVYVKDGDSVKIVRFGDPDMEIKRDDPEARRNFRARHNCSEKKDKTSAGYWSCRMWDEGASVSEVLGKREVSMDIRGSMFSDDDIKKMAGMIKRQINDDIFTTDIEAIARSVDLGLEGKIHVHEDRDGQSTYMPGESHEEYIEHMGRMIPEEAEEEEEEEEHNSPSVHIEITIKSDGEVIEKQEDQRIVYGWASVVEVDGKPVVDRQGDIIEEADLIEAVHDFVSNSRTGKVMHEGGQTSRIVDSIVFTKDLQKAMDIDLGKVGWFVGVKVDDDDTWQKVKNGELPMFSIGGRAMRESINE